MEGQDMRPSTYGEKAVGLNFNPSDNSDVAEIKKLYAEIIDFCNNEIGKLEVPAEGERIRLFRIAITEAQTAQMWAVKAITFK